MTATVLAAACLALTIGVSALGQEPGLVLRLRCWLAPSTGVCRDLARERENHALEAVEKELRDLNRLPPAPCFGPGPDTAMPCPP